MKKLIATLLLISSVAHAEVSCDIGVHAINRLKMTRVEEAKVKLFLKSKNYNYNPRFSFVNKSYDVSFNELHVAEDKSRFLVKNLDRPQKRNKIEVPLFLNGEPVKILKARTNLLDYFMDRGTPGFKLAMGVFRDLPKCNDKNLIAANDSARDKLKEIAVPNASGNFGMSISPGGIGF